MNSISEVNLSTTEGKLLFAALAKITSESQTDKTPDEVLVQITELSKSMFEEVKTEEIPDKENGLYRKYIVLKANGEKVDPKADFFVLRLDNGCKDKNHLAACRIAVLEYARHIAYSIPQLSEDLLDKYTMLPRILHYYKAVVRYNRLDDLVPGSLPNGSIVHVLCNGIQEEGEPYAGQLVFTPAESCLWYPLCDLVLFEEITSDQYKDALDRYLTLNEQTNG